MTDLNTLKFKLTATGKSKTVPAEAASNIVEVDGDADVMPQYTKVRVRVCVLPSGTFGRHGVRPTACAPRRCCPSR